MENIALHEKISSGMCRLCLSSDGALIDMFSFSSELESQIADAVSKCTSVHVEKHSELPTTVCKPCYMQLINTQKFQMQALKSDKTLQVYLKRLHGDDKQNILGSSVILSDIDGNSSLETNIAYQDKDDNSIDCEDIKHCGKYFESGCDEFEIDIVESHTEWDLNSSGKDSAFNTNLIVKSEPIINDKDLPDNDTEILSNFAKAQKNIKLENEVSTDTVYQCDFCNKCFKNSVNLSRHQPVHSGEKPYQCDVCNQCFNDSYNLRRHQRVHTGEKLNQCDVCNQYFNDSYNLRRHQRIHTGDKPYQCAVCNQCFSDPSNFKRHQRVHTGEKPYQCNVCNDCFRNSDTLRIHKRMHTGERPYHCDLCNKYFRDSANLRKHQRGHTGEKPYQCERCNRCFTMSSHLHDHIRAHTGEKPHQCDVCHKCFSVASKLRTHQRIHSGEKPYQCDVCNKCFSQLSSLKSHKRKHSSDA